MAKAIHISTLRKMLQAGDPVDISLWKGNGEILHYRNECHCGTISTKALAVLSCSIAGKYAPCAMFVFLR